MKVLESFVLLLCSPIMLTLDRSCIEWVCLAVLLEDDGAPAHDEEDAVPAQGSVAAHGGAQGEEDGVHAAAQGKPCPTHFASEKDDVQDCL